jgi:hypothetical protein
MSKLKIISRAKAKALGLTRYYSGKACPHGHVCEPSYAALGSCRSTIELRPHINDLANTRRKSCCLSCCSVPALPAILHEPSDGRQAGR